VRVLRAAAASSWSAAQVVEDEEAASVGADHQIVELLLDGGRWTGAWGS
jgi:hypothetical protein